MTNTPPAPLAKAGRPRSPAQDFEAGDRLGMRRMEMRLSLAQVANKLGIRTVKYRYLEGRFSVAAQNQYLDALAQILQVSPQWIAYGEGDPSAAYVSPNGDVSRANALDHESRVALAKRAARRRSDLRLTRTELALAIGISAAQVNAYQIALPLNLSAERQSLWEAALKVPSGWLMNRAMTTPEVINGPDSLTANGNVLSGDTVASEIRAIAAWLSRKSISRRTLDRNELTQVEKYHADIFSARYGLYGEEASILANIGKQNGVTRERIRQIMQKMSDRALDLTMETPNLARLKTEVDRLAPASIEEIDSALRSLLGQSLSIRSAQRFAAEILGRKVATMTKAPWAQNSSRAQMVEDDQNVQSDEFMRVIRSTALRMIRSAGAAQVHAVAGISSEELGAAVSAKQVRATCAIVQGFDWLTEKDGWFWFGPDSDNRLLHVTKKVLAAAARRVDIEDIYGAMGRSKRWNYRADNILSYAIDAPMSAILQVLSRVPWLTTVQKNDFILTSGIDPKDVLSNVEYAILELIRSGKGVTSKFLMDRDIVPRLKVTSIAVATAASNSPIFIQPGHGLYAVRGVDINPEGLLEASLSVHGLRDNPNGVALVSDEQGFYKWSFAFSQYQRDNRILTVPTALARLMQEGSYDVEDWDEPVFFVDGDGHKSKFFRKLVGKIVKQGIQVGDTAVLHVNPDTRQMRFAIERSAGVKLD